MICRLLLIFFPWTLISGLEFSGLFHYTIWSLMVDVDIIVSGWYY